jgi:hypothetical protein
MGAAFGGIGVILITRPTTDGVSSPTQPISSVRHQGRWFKARVNSLFAARAASNS